MSSSATIAAGCKAFKRRFRAPGSHVLHVESPTPDPRVPILWVVALGLAGMPAGLATEAAQPLDSSSIATKRGGRVVQRL